MLLSAVMVFGTVGVMGEVPVLKVQASGSRILTERFSNEMDEETGAFITDAGAALNERSISHPSGAVV